MRESDSSYYLTNCCDYEFIGKENDPFYKTLYKAQNKLFCTKCDRTFELNKYSKCGIDKSKYLYRYKNSNEFKEEIEKIEVANIKLS